MAEIKPAGWYHDAESGNPDLIRWWDGAQWTEFTREWTFVPPQRPSLLHRRGRQSSPESASAAR